MGESLSTRRKPRPNANWFVIISARTCPELNSGPVVPRLRPLIAWCSICQTATCANVSLSSFRHASYVVQSTGSINILLLQKHQNSWLQNCVRWSSHSNKTTDSVSRLLIFLARQRKRFVTTRTENCSTEFPLSFYSPSNSDFKMKGKDRNRTAVQSFLSPSTLPATQISKLKERIAIELQYRVSSLLLLSQQLRFQN